HELQNQPLQVNVLNDYVIDQIIQKTRNLSLEEEAIKQPNEVLKIGTRSKASKQALMRNWYPQPSFPDVQFEEKTQMTQAVYDGLAIHEWNIDGISDYLILNVLNEMFIASNAYRQRGKKDHEIAQLLVAGFTGQLKQWWDQYLTDYDRQYILTHTTIEKKKQTIKLEGQLPQTVEREESIEDAVNTLVYTLTNAFVGDPTQYHARSADILLNLKCPTLGDFRWYKDMFLSKVLIRADCSSPIWKEQFIKGLPSYFVERVKINLNAKYDGKISWETLTYGNLTSFIIISEGLRLCNESKVQSKLNKSFGSRRAELGIFCDQYGCGKIRPPSTIRKSSIKRYQKYQEQQNYRPYRQFQKKNYRKPYNSYNKRRPFYKRGNSKRNIQCYKCRSHGHYASTCPMKKKIN
ncbi:hypothetical protein NP118_23585, partial [Salmonella enterica]|nr:hypothetical protein [Salmonella enterica]